ncbi:MAG: hypothetical protein EB162_05630 [Euryarchaeota archaeon]|nr:hypothetical protein [Euryarchaeota archaeon]
MSSGLGAMWNAVNTGFEMAMGPETDDKVRKLAIAAAVIGFAAHLLLWVLHNSGQLTIEGDSMELVKSPLSALYTPFSILLAYEVYQLIRTIPGISNDVGFLLIECAAFLALFYTSLTYHSMKKGADGTATLSDEVSIFILTKKAIANLMLVVFAVIAFSSLTSWIAGVQDGGGSVDRTIFFLDFFTFLILADILILLISYWFYTDFRNLARNTGFVLSTVIIRVAISAAGVSSMILFTLSGVLGIAILRMFVGNQPVGGSS